MVFLFCQLGKSGQNQCLGGEFRGETRGCKGGGTDLHWIHAESLPQLNAVGCSVFSGREDALLGGYLLPREICVGCFFLFLFF